MASLGIINEQTSALYVGTLKNELGVVIDGGTLDSLTITAYDVTTGQIVNSRDAQNALNANGVTISAAGVIAWTLEPADSVIISGLALEYRKAMFVAAWGGAGVKQCRHEMTWIVLDLLKAT